METEWLPDAITDQKIAQVKKDLSEYIEKNSDKIDSNIPVFFGQVISILEKSFPDMTDAAYDRFIDDITIKVLEESRKSANVEYIENLFGHAFRIRRKPASSAIFSLILGMKLLDMGKYEEAIKALDKLRRVDAIVFTIIAYCYYAMATQESKNDLIAPGGRMSDMALQARETMIELARIHPPVNRLVLPHIVQDLRINKIFWFMLKLGIEWFPSEVEFIKIGLKKAKKDEANDLRNELLKIASERFYSDIFFLRELYHFKIEMKDANGAAAAIKQMMQHHPDELEPIYYALKLSIVSNRGAAYQQFRYIAISKKMPVHVLMLLDFAFELANGKKSEAFTCLDDIKKRLTTKNHYFTLIEYVANDVFSDDEKRVRSAKKAMMDSLDQYCMKLLKMKDE